MVASMCAVHRSLSLNSAPTTKGFQVEDALAPSIKGFRVEDALAPSTKGFQVEEALAPSTKGFKFRIYLHACLRSW